MVFRKTRRWGWINGGFFVLDPAVIDRIEGDDTVWEQDLLKVW